MHTVIARPQQVYFSFQLITEANKAVQWQRQLAFGIKRTDGRFSRFHKRNLRNESSAVLFSCNWRNT